MSVTRGRDAIEQRSVSLLPGFVKTSDSGTP